MEHTLQNEWLKMLRKKQKGGNNTMDIKSRYEVIADLEEKKRNLIVQRDSLDKKLKEMERGLKELMRDVEDKEEAIKDFKESMEQEKETTTELIESVNASLERLTKVSKDK